MTKAIQIFSMAMNTSWKKINCQSSAGWFMLSNIILSSNTLLDTIVFKEFFLGFL